MTELDQLVDSLLYEGYALYPYTSDATKNATPTPFGIVYPPAYAAGCEGANDHARLECVADRGSAFTATFRWLDCAGAECRFELGPIGWGERTTGKVSDARLTLRTDARDRVVRCCVHNTAEVATGLDRAEAVARSLLSLHILVHAEQGRFISPLVARRESVNTWPVLATDNDDTILGAAIVLPDHPKVAPRSYGNLFDNTEIEEALVLHVHALTDEERAAVGDPKVRAMLERTLALAPSEITDLHSGLREVAGPASGEVDRELHSGLREVADPAMGEVDNNPGEDRATVDGVTFVKGRKLLLKPGTDRSVHDRLLDGHPATLERIYIDYDGRVHLAVTVDDDPGQQLMRATGRYLFFLADEVQPL